MTEEEQREERAVVRTNASAPATDCDRCGGDRFVVLSKDEENEVCKPCPDCNPIAATDLEPR